MTGIFNYDEKLEKLKTILKIKLIYQQRLNIYIYIYMKNLQIETKMEI